MMNRKTAFAATLLAVGAACAGSAQAADVHWSVGINLPAVGTVITNAPAYPAYPVYQAPRSVIVAPPPVVVYRPAPQVVYRPVPVAPVYYRGGWYSPRHDHHHGHHHDHDRGDRRDRHHDEYGDSRRGEQWTPETRRYHQ